MEASSIKLIVNQQLTETRIEYVCCTLEVFHVHSYQDQFIKPNWAECVFFTYFA